jgi:glycosyltransferase involved in cell wall biosynthesis
VNDRLVAFVPYAPSSEFRARLEDSLGAVPEYVSLAELRRRSLGDVLRRLRSVRGAGVVLPLETDDVAVLLPLVETFALAIMPSRIEVVAPDLSRRTVARRDAVPAMAGLTRASASGLVAVRSARRRLEQLSREPRTRPVSPDEKRILYLNTNLWVGLKAGGAFAHVAGVVNALEDAGFDVQLATLGEPIGIGEDVVVHRLAPPSPMGLPHEGTYYRVQRQATRQALEIARRTAPGLVYQRMSVANFSGVEVSRALGIPLVLEYNGPEVWLAKNWGAGLRYEEEARLAEEISLRHAHLIVTVSEVLRDQLMERGVEPERIVTHPNGVDPGLFDPATDGSAVRAALVIPADATVAGFAGTFGQWHGVEVLARAIANLAGSSRPWLEEHKVRFLFVGDGVRAAEVRHILEAAGATDFVTFAGVVPQLAAPVHLAACDILVSPHVPNSDGTPFFGSPTKLFEYMSMGKPVVASRLGQIANVLDPALDAADLPDRGPAADEAGLGILAAPGDVDELATAIRFAVERPDWRQVLGRNAREAVLERYTWARHAAAITSALAALDSLE